MHECLPSFFFSGKQILIIILSHKKDTKRRSTYLLKQTKANMYILYTHQIIIPSFLLYNKYKYLGSYYFTIMKILSLPRKLKLQSAIISKYNEWWVTILVLKSLVNTFSFEFVALQRLLSAIMTAHLLFAGCYAKTWITQYAHMANSCEFFLSPTLKKKTKIIKKYCSIRW